MRRLALVLLATAWATSARAQLFPARSGESGLLDVPDSEVIGQGPALLGAEFRVDKPKTGPADFGPLPVYAVAPLWRRLDVGLQFREWGQPGDPRPARFLVGGALKLQLLDATSRRPGFALDFTGDRLNTREVLGSRLIASTAPIGNVRFSAFVGGESGAKSGVTWGGAVTVGVVRDVDVVLEALGGPQGNDFGGAVRWRATNTLGMFLGFNDLPKDGGWRASVGFAFGPTRRREAPAPSAEAAALATATQDATKGPPRFTTERPEFKLKLRIAAATSDDPRSLRHGPWNPTGPIAGARGPAVAAGARSSAPSLEDLAEAQLREQESLAEGRERRVRSTAEQLDARDRTAQDETTRLAERERELAAREQQLEARERRLGRGGAPTPQQRDLEALEVQLAAQERNLAAQERSAGAAIDAAQGRERDAAARADAERVEASRLAASVSGTSSRTQQLDVRKQALGARNRQLAALEARLVARGERIDTLERQLRTRASRLDAWQRRLDTRSERLDLLERRAADPRAAAVLAPPRAEAKAAAPKDKAIFVMVVKSPTAIVKERGGAPSAPGVPGAVQPGTAVEKAVAAATVVTFGSPTAQLSELDRDAVDNIAKLAAAEGCELLIWARAKDPSLMPEAQRRAAEIRTRVMAVAQLSDKQVVTRITTRPGAQGVDVVVSALRESARPAAAAAAPAARAGQLEAGEGGKRQIREAVRAAQPSIEACVGELMEQKKLSRAEGSLKLTVSAAGKVVKVLSGDGDLAGAGLAECLSSASGGWTFPPADAEYAVEVPITVIRGGAQR